MQTNRGVCGLQATVHKNVIAGVITAKLYSCCQCQSDARVNVEVSLEYIRYRCIVPDCVDGNVTTYNFRRR